MPDDAPTSSLAPIVHPDILRHIVSFADRPTLVTCLRTNSTFFELAGPSLYHTVSSRRGKLPISLTRLAKGASIVTSTSSGESTPARKNFKSQLLGHVCILEISDHPYCEGPDVRAACRQFGSLETLRIIALGQRVEPMRAARGTCKGPASCPLTQLRVNRLVLCTLADSWPGLVSKYCSIWRRTRNIVLLPDSLRGLYQLCRVFRSPLLNPKPYGNTEERGERIVRILCGGARIDTPLDEKNIHCFDTLLDHGAAIYIIGDPDDGFVPGAVRIGDETWIAAVNSLNYLVTLYHNFYCLKVTSTSNPSSSSGTSDSQPRNLPRSRADYLKLEDNCGELDEETMDQIRKDEADYLRRKVAK